MRLAESRTEKTGKNAGSSANGRRPKRREKLYRRDPNEASLANESKMTFLDYRVPSVSPLAPFSLFLPPSLSLSLSLSLSSFLSLSVLPPLWQKRKHEHTIRAHQQNLENHKLC